MVIGLPSSVLTPLSSGIDWPTAGSVPLFGRTASAVPFTVTGPCTTGWPATTVLGPAPLPSPEGAGDDAPVSTSSPPRVVAKVITPAATTTSAMTATIHTVVRRRAGGGGAGAPRPRSGALVRWFIGRAPYRACRRGCRRACRRGCRRAVSASGRAGASPPGAGRVHRRSRGPGDGQQGHDRSEAAQRHHGERDEAELLDGGDVAGRLERAERGLLREPLELHVVDRDRGTDGGERDGVEADGDVTAHRGDAQQQHQRVHGDALVPAQAARDEVRHLGEVQAARHAHGGDCPGQGKGDRRQRRPELGEGPAAGQRAGTHDDRAAAGHERQQGEEPAHRRDVHWERSLRGRSFYPAPGSPMRATRSDRQRLRRRST